MYVIKVVDNTHNTKVFPPVKPESGVTELEIYANDDFLISYRLIERYVEYRESDVNKNNPNVDYKLCNSQLRGMLEAAYDAGRRDQVKDTAKQLKTIFGLT